jgi:hypothetical protein
MSWIAIKTLRLGRKTKASVVVTEFLDYQSSLIRSPDHTSNALSAENRNFELKYSGNYDVNRIIQKKQFL